MTHTSDIPIPTWAQVSPEAPETPKFRPQFTLDEIEILLAALQDSVESATTKTPELREQKILLWTKLYKFQTKAKQGKVSARVTGGTKNISPVEVLRGEAAQKVADSSLSKVREFNTKLHELGWQNMGEITREELEVIREIKFKFNLPSSFDEERLYAKLIMQEIGADNITDATIDTLAENSQIKEISKGRIYSD